MLGYRLLLLLCLFSFLSSAQERTMEPSSLYVSAQEPTQPSTMVVTGSNQEEDSSFLSFVSPQIHSTFQLGRHDANRKDPGVFRAQQLIAPGMLLTLGSLGAFAAHEVIDRSLNQDFNNWRGDKRWTGDDYLQYAPLAAYLASGFLPNETPLIRDRILTSATSAISTALLTNALKYTVKQARPSGAHNSFPSGHTATAFMGAELLRLAYKDKSPWITIGAYTVAAGIGFSRLYNNRHWLSDVVAGAGVGILSAHISYWLLPSEQRWFNWNKQSKKEFSFQLQAYPADTYGLSFRLVL